MHPQLIPYEILTEREKKKNRDRALELLRFLQMHGFRVHGGLVHIISNIFIKTFVIWN